MSIVGDLIPEMLGFLMRHDPDFDIDEFDPVGDYHRLTDPFTPLDLRTADLSEFRDRGGKLLIYQGWNDFPLRPQRAIAYLESVERAMGGADAVAGFFRMFMVPGMVHCAGGPGAWEADYVDPLVKWTEQGEAPGRIVAEHPGPRWNWTTSTPMPGPGRTAPSPGRSVRTRNARNTTAKAVRRTRRASAALRPDGRSPHRPTRAIGRLQNRQRARAGSRPGASVRRRVSSQPS